MNNIDCLKREEGVTYIATISGGKDSVTMCDLLLKNGYPLDYIFFYDTLMELPMMYKYIKKIKEYFKDRYNKEIIITKPETTFEEWCFGVIRDKNADLNGWIRGIPMVWSNPCYWRRESKEKPANKLIKEYDFKKSITYIGFTLGENRSVQDTETQKYLYPLKDIFKMKETDCQQYLINQEMENPIYRFLTRSGCGMCTAQSDRAWKGVYDNDKETWEYMKWVEKRLFYYENLGMKVKNKFWFTNNRSCKEMEKQFNNENKSLFYFSDEPLKDCFCKI